MAPAVERREHSRRHSPERSFSPVRERRRDKERGMERSPRKKSSSSRSARSPARDRSRSPDHARSKGYSRSPSPRSKRLKRVRGEREAERLELDRDRQRERGEERRSGREKDDGGSSRRASRHERSASPQDRGHRSGRSSRSPTRASKPGGASGEVAKPRATENLRSDDDDSIAKMKAAEDALKVKDKAQQKPSFELSGKLAEETNRVRGVTLLFNEPPDACKPDVRWRLYVFKAGEVLNEPLYIHRQSCYLFGRERRVADIPTDHPSCSKQHAVLQYRLVEKEQPDGLLSKQIRPYIMDLGSTNGTFINDNRVESQRYYELFEKDTIKFGNSSREYVMLHENSIT
ncbi:putative transcription factor interactor and regulator FHA-SMAD family [Dioscorea sansibarensis]